MATKHTVTAAACGKAMTLAELAAFVQEAMRLDIDPGTVITVTATFGQKIKRITVEGEVGQ